MRYFKWLSNWILAGKWNTCVSSRLILGAKIQSQQEPILGDFQKVF